ncbi:hypothetical protein P3T18_000045 [Paraburkholderia sp. GAS199]|uniref:carboxypeptidase regulatory-like domain-containing protein n=1 Tax=Paraburkholderia sp. GAS199 TaxID=3035126 RepID=UPI003D19BFDF
MKSINALASIVLATTLTIGVTDSVRAQNMTTTASTTLAAGLPAILEQGNVRYVSGGVGHDEAKAMRRAASGWPLSLDFYGPTRDYLADVHVRLEDANGIELLQADSRGPYMLLQLQPGSYTVFARYKNKEQKRTIKVSPTGHVNLPFTFDVQ